MRRLSWLLICVAVIVFWTVAPPSPAWVDRYYTSGLYTALASFLVPLTGNVALPVTALLLAALLAGVVLSVSLAKRRRGPWARLRWLGRGVAAAVTLYALFIVVWGANYGRTAVETRLNLSAGTAPSAREIIAFAEALGNVIRRDHAAAPNWDTDLTAGGASLRGVVQRLEGRAVTLPRFVKHTPPGFLLLTGHATGLTVPWTLEAYVDRALPYPYGLATALHELAHVAGYAGEAEADFIAGVAGLTSENASVRYSAALVLFSRAARSLPPERYRALLRSLPERVQKDIAAFGRAYRRYRAPEAVTRLQTRVYDRYLRSQRVGAGVKDYDRATVLLVAARRDGVLEFGREAVLLYASN